MTALSLDDLAALEQHWLTMAKYFPATNHPPIILSLISHLRAAQAVVDKAKLVDDAYLATDNYVDQGVADAIECMRDAIVDTIRIAP